MSKYNEVERELMEKMKGAVVPVVAIKNIEKVYALEQYLVDNKIKFCEITYRTDCASEAIEYMSKNENIIVGAGTILTLEQAKDAVDSGAKFLVSPAINLEVMDYAISVNIPIIVGVETASEVLLATSRGVSFVKLFPANIAGGVGKLKAFESVFKGVKFMPTGGVNKDNYMDYLNQKNVVCVGGTFVIPKEILE